MSNINRDYRIKLDVKTSQVYGANSIYFFSSDKNTCNLFIEVVNEVDDTLELMVRIVSPSATTRADVIELKAKKHNNSLYEVNLPNT